MNHTDYPYWAFESKRVWKQTKRQALKKVLHELDELIMGCSFYPNDGYADVTEITARCRSLRDKLSVRHWGR